MLTPTARSAPTITRRDLDTTAGMGRAITAARPVTAETPAEVATAGVTGVEAAGAMAGVVAMGEGCGVLTDLDHSWSTIPLNGELTG